MNLEEMTLDEAIDSVVMLRDQAKALQKQADAAKANFNEAKKELVALLDEQGLKRAGSKLFSVSVLEKESFNVKDWDAVFKHIKNTGDFGLLQRRISSNAYKELLQLGQKIDGVEEYQFYDLSIRKAG